MNRKISLFLMCVFSSWPVYAANEIQCNGPYVEFFWTEKTIGQINEHQNHNRLVGQEWGIGNRYPVPESAIKAGINPAVPYRKTDPGFMGPNGERWGIEIDFGNLTISPRIKGSKNLKFYTDFGQTDTDVSGVSRAEIHIRKTLKDMSLKEGDTLWLGWSEYYSHLDNSRGTTLLQFRNQPSEKTLEENGFTRSEINELKSRGIFKGGPASGIIAKEIKGKVYYNFSSRVGTQNKWSVTDETSHTVSFPIETGRWYDFVIQMKYSQDNNGRYRVWIYEVDDPNEPVTYSVKDVPEWDYLGSTMYEYPKEFGKPIASPEIRFGVYRHNAQGEGANEVSKKDRYMTKYVGPLRLWVGESDVGFNMVKPRSLHN